MKKTLLAFLLVAFAIANVAFVSAAQSNGAVSGVVTDETTGVLAGVTITAADLDSGRQFVGLTDSLRWRKECDEILTLTTRLGRRNVVGKPCGVAQ